MFLSVCLTVFDSVFGYWMCSPKQPVFCSPCFWFVLFLEEPQGYNKGGAKYLSLEEPMSGPWHASLLPPGSVCRSNLPSSFHPQDDSCGRSPYFLQISTLLSLLAMAVAVKVAITDLTSDPIRTITASPEFKSAWLYKV